MANKAAALEALPRPTSGMVSPQHALPSAHAIRRHLDWRQGRGEPLRVLVVTESKFQYELFRRLFKKSGSETVHVTTNDQALDALEALPFSLVVIDDCSDSIDGLWTSNLYHWSTVMAGTETAPILMLCSDTETAQRINRNEECVVALESSATNIVKALASLGLLGKR